MKLKIRAYRTINEPDSNEAYLNGHIKVLMDYGIENITSNNNEWCNHPHTYCVVAIDEKDEIIGGIRVQLADGVTPLPVEQAIGHLDDRIHEVVKKYAIDGGVGELCGLWNSKKVKGYGISVILTRAGISIVNQLNFRTMTGICAGYTLDMFRRVGFVINKDLGEHGDFVYPNENYIANVVGILDADSLETAHEYDKSRMKFLRSNPVSIATEEGPRDPVEIEYNLKIDDVGAIELPAKFLEEDITKIKI